MKTQEEAQQMLHLSRLGFNPNRIATLMGCHRDTVVRYLRQGEWRAIDRAGQLQDVSAWVEATFLQHAGNADVVRQLLLAEHGIEVSLRTVARAVRPLRQQLKAARVAAARFESAPGDQLQIDFGSKRVPIGTQTPSMHVFVATLGYSRRQFVAAHADESQAAWFDGLARAFRHFGGVPRTVLMDNPKALVTQPRAATTAPTFNHRLLAFARYWKFSPRACHPYRAQTKGKDERSVAYVKHNELAGHRLASWGALARHLERWLHPVAACRIHGTTGATPLELFDDERACLTPMAARPPFGTPSELQRPVSRNGFVAVATNHYAVPWQLVGEAVQVSVGHGQVTIYAAGVQVAGHRHCEGRHQRLVNPTHYERLGDATAPDTPGARDTTLQRPLDAYARFVAKVAS